MLIALLAPVASGAADKAELETSSTVKQDTRMKFTFTVTNGSGENVENVLIRPPESSFTEAIGGSTNVASLLDGADNLDNAAAPLDRASDNLELAADNLATATAAFSNVAAHLESAADRIGDYGEDNQNEVSGYLWETMYVLEDASSAFDGDDFSAAADNLDLAGGYLEDAGAVPTATGADDPLEDAGVHLGLAADGLRSGDLGMFATQLSSAVDYLQDSSDNYYATGKALLKTASGHMDDAIADLSTAQAGFADAAAYIADAGTNMIAASDFLFSAGTDISTVSNLNIAGYGIIDAEISLADAGSSLQSSSQDIYSAGDQLGTSSASLSISADELGVDLGGEYLSAAAAAEEAAGDNLATETCVSVRTASEEIATMTDKLSSTSDKIASTADDLGPADWDLYEGSEVGMRSNAVVFRGIGDNAIAPGASETFSYLWTTPPTGTAKEHDLGVWVYRGGDWTRIDVVRITVEGRKPTVDITVTQEGMKENNLVGDEYDNGTATVTIEASEEVTLGDVTLIDNDTGENLLPPLSVPTLDNKTFVGDFEVGEWDDNATTIKVASAEDVYGNLTGVTKKAFVVDTRAPVIIESGIGMADLSLEEKALAGTDKVYNVDNAAVHEISGMVEDNFTGTVSVAGMTYDNDDNYVRRVYVEWDGASARAEEVLTPESAFKKEITLDPNEPLTVKVRSVDWTGNVGEVIIENVFIDNQAPEVSFDSISGEGVGTHQWDSAEEPIADNTPKISLTVSDEGLGVAREDLKVYLDGNDNIEDGTMTLLENMGSYSWDPETGQETFENVIENAGAGLPDGVYWIHVKASDNIKHDGSEWVTESKSFEIYTGAVTPPENLEPSKFTGDVTPTFEWDIAPGDRTVVSYELVVDDDSDYSSPVMEETIDNADRTSFTPENALEPGKYYMKVTAEYDCGLTASAEGSFNIGAAEVELEEGWNMISLPIMPENTAIEAVLDNVQGEVVKVWAYDAEAGEWLSYVPGEPEASDLTTMEAGRGYWIEMASSATLKVSGRILPPPGGVMPVIQLYEGWNLIGYKGTEEMTRRNYLGVTIEDLTAAMYEYDPESDTFDPVGPDEYLEPGQAYWIAVTESVTLYP